MSLNLNWFKSYDSNEIHAKTKKSENHKKNTAQISFFLQNREKNENGNIWILCHNF